MAQPDLSGRADVSLTAAALPMVCEHLGIAIARPYAAVYGYLAQPAKFAEWAAGLAGALRQDSDGTWRASGPSGEIVVRFTPENAFGICDHHVRLPDGSDVFVPLRVIANGAGSEVLFTLFRQPGMTDEIFARDRSWVREDLVRLKSILEDM